MNIFVYRGRKLKNAKKKYTSRKNLHDLRKRNELLKYWWNMKFVQWMKIIEKLSSVNTVNFVPIKMIEMCDSELSISTRFSANLLLRISLQGQNNCAAVASIWMSIGIMITARCHRIWRNQRRSREFKSESFWTLEPSINHGCCACTKTYYNSA